MNPIRDKSGRIEKVEIPDAAFQARSDLYARDAREALRDLYGEREDFEAILTRIFEIVWRAYLRRDDELKELDLRRSQRPDWFQRADIIGYTAYVDRFAGGIGDVADRLSYLKEIGVTYLHLLPFLKTRPARNDGGFAVSDYSKVDPQYGDMEALSQLTKRLRAAGISLCIDFVMNHTADDHEWAQRARAGDQRYKDYYHFLPDKALTEEYEQSLKPVFPESAPGHFTFVEECGEWVWTTFYPYQWDLNYANPFVFEEMLEALLNLANHGVEVFRLDAAPFLWKRKGTDCRNQPEVFSIIRALRALAAIAAPSAILKAEAIVPSYQLIQYLGAGENAGKECQLAYNATLMTLLWGALADGDVRRLVDVLRAAPPPPMESSWVNYVRCHDEIGWGVLTEERAGYSPQSWRDYAARLRTFYAGSDSGSFARGVLYQRDGVSGTTASLCGLETAIENDDAAAIELAISRMLALYTVIFAYGGAPLINMGDEIGQLNDYDYRTRPRFDGDGRWLHRGYMDWRKAARRHGDSLEAKIFSGLARLAEARANCQALAKSVAMVRACGGGRALSLHHRNARGALLAIVNLSDAPATIELPDEARWRDFLSDRSIVGKSFALPPYGRLWLIPDREAAPR